MALRREPCLYFSLFSWWNLPPDVQCCDALGQLNQEPLGKTFRFSIHSSLSESCILSLLCVWSDSLRHVFQRFVLAHISSCCAQIWVNLLPSSGSTLSSSFSHLYCSSVVTPTLSAPLFSLFPHWCTVVFSASGFFFCYIHRHFHLFDLDFFVSFLDTIAKQEKSNLSSNYEWRHRCSDFSPVG